MAIVGQIWDTSSLTAPQHELVRQAVEVRSRFPWPLLSPGLLAGNEWSTPGKTVIPVNVRSLANFAQEAAANGWIEGIHYHAIRVNPLTGKLVSHDDAVTSGIVESDVASAVYGLFWFYGLVEVEETLVQTPILFIEVFLAEGAHAIDFYYMLPTGKRGVIHAIMCSGHTKHAWFQPTPYFEMPGEGFMAFPIAGFSDVPVTLQGFSHQAIEPALSLVKKVLVPTIDPPPPPKPVTTRLAMNAQPVGGVRGTKLADFSIKLLDANDAVNVLDNSTQVTVAIQPGNYNTRTVQAINGIVPFIGDIFRNLTGTFYYSVRASNLASIVSDSFIIVAEGTPPPSSEYAEVMTPTGGHFNPTLWVRK